MNIQKTILQLLMVLAFHFPLCAYQHNPLIRSALTEEHELLDEAIHNFIANNFSQALDKFNFFLDYASPETANYGTALWGRALCNVLLENDVEVDDDMTMLIDYSVCCPECKDHLLLALFNPSVSATQPVVVNLFADENENISISECKRRAAGIARAIGELIDEKMPTPNDSLVRPKFKNFINLLVNEAYRCCESGNRWARCLEPLALQWQAWKKPGIPQQPK